MSIGAELDALTAAIAAAVAGVSSEAVVRTGDVDGEWFGPWPLIIVKLGIFEQIHFSGGGLGTKGQDASHQNQYTVEIRDAVRPRDTSDERVTTAQRRGYAIVDAISEYFKSLANAQLGGAAYRAGERIYFRAAGPFKLTDTGGINVVLVGTVSVIGNRQIQVP